MKEKLIKEYDFNNELTGHGPEDVFETGNYYTLSQFRDALQACDDYFKGHRLWATLLQTTNMWDEWNRIGSIHADKVLDAACKKLGFDLFVDEEDEDMEPISNVLN